MKLLRRVFDSPLALVVIGISLGLLVHYLTTPARVGNPGPAMDGGAADGVGEPDEPGESERLVKAEKPEELPGSAIVPASLRSAADDRETDKTDATEEVGEKLKPPSLESKKPLSFPEIWAYLHGGEESRWRREAPITDLCLFNFRLDAVGKLEGSVKESFLEEVRRAGIRSHLVVAASGGTLFHFLLNPRNSQRERLLSDLARLAGRYPVDGFQLDFEGLRGEDRAHLVSFLEELRARLPAGQIFSLAVPAKTERSRRAYHYRDLRDIADRLFIMVYDFHWRGGPPGSITPRDWHDRVVAHCLEELPAEKIVIGLPFYGRIWQTTKVARATRYIHLKDYLERPHTRVEYDRDGSHRFTFTQEIEAEGWFEDASSLHAKLAAARSRGIRAVGFWRLGQEDTRIWELLRKR